MLLIFCYGDQTNWSADRLQILRFMMPIIAIEIINIKNIWFWSMFYNNDLGIWTSVIIWAFISIFMIIQATRHQGWPKTRNDKKLTL